MACTYAFPITSDFESNGFSRVEPLSNPELLTNDSEYVLVNFSASVGRNKDTHQVRTGGRLE